MTGFKSYFLHLEATNFQIVLIVTYIDMHTPFVIGINYLLSLGTCVLMIVSSDIVLLLDTISRGETF